MAWVVSWSNKVWTRAPEAATRVATSQGLPLLVDIPKSVNTVDTYCLQAFLESASRTGQTSGGGGGAWGVSRKCRMDSNPFVFGCVNILGSSWEGLYPNSRRDVNHVGTLSTLSICVQVEGAAT